MSSGALLTTNASQNGAQKRKKTRNEKPAAHSERAGLFMAVLKMLLT
jgi:hypothetical protein